MWRKSLSWRAWAQAQAGSIHAVLGEREEQAILRSFRQAAAAVLYIDKDAVRGGIGAQPDLRSLKGELEGVLQQVAHRRQQQFAIGVDCQSRIHRQHEQPAFAYLRLE